MVEQIEAVNLVDLGGLSCCDDRPAVPSRRMIATENDTMDCAISLLLTVLLSGAGAHGQDLSTEVRKAIDNSLLAGQKKDVASLSQYLADDLRWVARDGTVVGKKERIAGMSDRGRGPTLEDVDIQVAGHTALVVMTGLFSNGERMRMVETLLKRDGRWQLVLHASITMK
jgi:ketosteroid isomerase-like protein